MVTITWLRLVISEPMTWSRLASVLVTEAVCDEQALQGAALALEDRDDLVGELVDVGRRQRRRTAA